MVDRSVLGVAVVIAFIAMACGGVEHAPSTARDAMTRPVRAAAPMVRDQALASAAEQGCRAASALARRLPVVLHDQRGDGIDTVIFAGATGRASCQVARGGSGDIAVLASGESETPEALDIRWDGIRVHGMSSTSGSDTGTVTDISGQVGAAIASLRILLADGHEVVATTSNGWFYATWPGEVSAVALAGDDANGRLVASTTP